MAIKSVIFLSIISVFITAGCSARYMEGAADREVYRIIEEKEGQARDEILPGETLPAEEKKSLSLDLREALAMAAENNKTYAERRENVYLNVLDLTYQRHQFTTRYGAGGSASLQGNGEDSLSARFNLQLIRWLQSGARITLDIGKDFLAYLSGDRDRDLYSIITMNLLQPLLRGAGRQIATESLVQAERDSIYSIRGFLRYQKEFSIEATERYLNILLLENRKENFYNNYESLKRTRERIEMLAEAGRAPSIQVDQARQNEYDAHQRWITSVNSFDTAIDNFKIYLGLSPDTILLLDYSMLDSFIATGVQREDIDIDDFIENALARRMDLLTQYDRLQDAERRVYTAIDAARPRLDLRARISASTARETSPTLDFQSPSYSVGLELDLPIDSLPERNQYKRAVITLERAERDFEEKLYSVRLEIIQQHRNLEEAYQRYLIQENSLKLAEQRIKSTDLLLQAGRATIRDLLEAEEAYLRSQNELAGEVVNYIISYLRFLHSSESLELDETGVWRGAIYERIIEKSL